MKTKLKLRSVFGFAFAVILQLHGQGTFVNLNFEHPVLPLTPGPVPFSNAFPGWTRYGAATTAYNDISLGGAVISLHDSNSIFYLQLQGSYATLVQGSSAGPPTSAIIALTGQLPVDAASVRFWAAPVSNFQVTLGGQLIPLFLLDSTPTYNILGGDVSAFAGQTQELRFTVLPNNVGYFDNVQFSNQPIPEPSAFALVVLGASSLFLFRRKKN